VRGKASDRKLRLFAVACCWPLWPWLTEACSREAVLTADKFADGLASRPALADARAAMKPDFRNRHTISLRKAILAETGDRRRAAAESARWAASWDAARKALRVSARDAAEAASLASWGALSCSAGNAGPATERSPCGRLSWLARDVFGNPFRPVAVDSAWRTADVVALAHAAYDERFPAAGELDPARLAVLADALLCGQPHNEEGFIRSADPARACILARASTSDKVH
jgi:hypothetical protein